MNELFLKI